MPHLSLLRLPKSDGRWRNLSRYQAHQLAWKAFPDHEERPFLFHLAEHADRFGLLVQSTAAPDWSTVPDVEIGVKTTDFSRTSVGDVLSFSLLANATAMREYPDGTRRRVSVGANPDLRRARAEERGLMLTDVDLDRETTLLRWLDRQGERGGFTLNGELTPNPDRVCHVGPTVAYRVRKGDNRRGKPMTIHACNFTGRLTVTNPEAFTRVRVNGIGRAKGFGFGLLMAIES